MKNDKRKTGVLLVNLGTPDSPKTGDVRKYLREFLMDGRVIDISPLGRWMLVNLIIAPFRAPKSAKIYREVWTEQGSPIKYYSENITAQLQEQLGSDYDVRLGMRYQNPSLNAVLEAFKQVPLKKLIVIPLFPQYASATSGSVHQKVMEICAQWPSIPDIEFAGPFSQRQDVLRLYANNARPLLDSKAYDHILFSYHGLPERQITKSDHFGVCQLGACCNKLHSKNALCYRAQCFATTRGIAHELNLEEDQYSTCFQSRLGNAPWLQPYTEDRIYELRKEGKEKVLVFSPAFVSDCLETTIEIGEEYREIWDEEGGKDWDLVPSLNDHPDWVQALKNMVMEMEQKPAELSPAS